MPPQRDTIGRLAAVVAAVAIMIVVIGAGLVLVTSRPSAPTTIATPSSSTSGPMSYSTEPVTIGSSSVSIDGTLAADCPSGQTNSSGFVDVAAGTNGPTVFCVQFYYYNAFFGYNASSPIMLNVSNALTIQAVQDISSDGVVYPQLFDGASNFTLTASQSQLVIGGPTNVNEGTMVAYALEANSGASGTYQLGFFSSASFSSWLLGPQAPESCGYYGELVAGNGQPNYAQNLGGCLTYPTSYLSSSVSSGISSYYTLPGIPYPLLVGNLYFRIVGVTNSTG
jgi:hypothetical protein